MNAQISRNHTFPSFWRQLLRWPLQILIGGLIFGSAVGKALDLPGFIEVLKTYEAFPPSMIGPLGLGITGGEFFLGIWILSGWRLPMSAMVGACMNSVYALWITITLLRGLELANCGCFGVYFPQPLTWFSPIEDVVLVALCILLAYVAQTNARRGQTRINLGFWTCGNRIESIDYQLIRV